MEFKTGDNQLFQSSKDTITERKFLKFPKRLINKTEKKKRLNARLMHLVRPKTPLMIFFELYKDIPINVEQTLSENGMHYTASIVVDGQLYTGKHLGKIQAKQKACENFLRVLLTKKISEQSVIKRDRIDLEIEADTSAKSKGPPLDDFPWSHFASLAMHNLMNLWELQPISKDFPEKTKVVGSMESIPQNPENYHPVQFLYKMAPGIHFTEKTLSLHNPSLFEVCCELNGMSFKGRGSTKKAAKKESSILAIKHFWNFDFHSLRENPS